MFAYLAVEPNGNELIFSEPPCRIDEYSTCGWFSNSDSSQCVYIPPRYHKENHREVYNLGR